MLALASHSASSAFADRGFEELLAVSDILRLNNLAQMRINVYSHRVGSKKQSSAAPTFKSGCAQRLRSPELSPSAVGWLRLRSFCHSFGIWRIAAPTASPDRFVPAVNERLHGWYSPPSLYTKNQPQLTESLGIFDPHPQLSCEVNGLGRANDARSERMQDKNSLPRPLPAQQSFWHETDAPCPTDLAACMLLREQSSAATHPKKLHSHHLPMFLKIARVRGIRLEDAHHGEAADCNAEKVEPC